MKGQEVRLVDKDGSLDGLDRVVRLQLPDAEAQCVELVGMIRSHLTQSTLLVDIQTGGA